MTLRQEREVMRTLIPAPFAQSLKKGAGSAFGLTKIVTKPTTFWRNPIPITAAEVHGHKLLC